MKKIYYLLLIVKKLNSKNFIYDSVNAIAWKFRMKIDTLAELHEQLVHHEFYDCTTSLTHK